MIKASHILLSLVFIFTIKTSFGMVNAFLGDDLGLNLYKQIDQGIIELEGDEYSYEMKGQKKGGKIEIQINKVLKTKGFGNCKISESLSEDDILKISSGNIQLLSTKLSSDCKSGNKTFNINTLNSLQSHIKDYKSNAAKKAQQKAKQTYNISRIGMYADGNTKNSPFDIIQDIKDIDTIVFTQTIEYNGEKPINDGGFADYLQGKFIDIPKKLTDDVNSSDFVKGANDLLGAESQNNSINEIDIVEAQQEGVSDIETVPSLIFGNDNTQYACINNVESSGLSQEYLGSLGLNTGIHEPSSGIGNLGGLDNKSQNNGNESVEQNYSEILDEEIALLDTGYKKVNDNSSWKCSNFFCITVDFITNKHSVFGGEKMNSIQSIVEKSNEHLKKFVNSSLIQSKMTTNNFELPLRDLKLSEIFSFGMVITKKTPPILNLEKNEKKSSDENPLSAKNIFCKRWESEGLKCNRQNDLEIFLDSDGETKSIIDSGDLTVVTAAQKFAQKKAQQQTQSLMDEFITKAIQRDAGLKETDELYKEFLEIERFVASIQDYSNDLNALVKVMNEIPIHP